MFPIFVFFSLARGRFPRPFGFAFLVHEQLLFWGAHEFLGSTVCTGRMDDMLEKMQVCWFPLCSCGLVLANFSALGARVLLASFSANAVLFVFTLRATPRVRLIEKIQHSCWFVMAMLK